MGSQVNIPMYLRVREGRVTSRWFAYYNRLAVPNWTLRNGLRGLEYVTVVEVIHMAYEIDEGKRARESDRQVAHLQHPMSLQSHLGVPAYSCTGVNREWRAR